MAIPTTPAGWEMARRALSDFVRLPRREQARIFDAIHTSEFTRALWSPWHPNKDVPTVENLDSPVFMIDRTKHDRCYVVYSSWERRWAGG